MLADDPSSNCILRHVRGSAARPQQQQSIRQQEWCLGRQGAIGFARLVAVQLLLRQLFNVSQQPHS